MLAHGWLGLVSGSPVAGLEPRGPRRRGPLTTRNFEAIVPTSSGGQALAAGTWTRFAPPGEPPFRFCLVSNDLSRLATHGSLSRTRALLSRWVPGTMRGIVEGAPS